MNAPLRHGGLVLGSLVLVFACSSSETAPSVTDAAADGAPTSTCELRDGACSEGCCPQPGNRYDPARDCIEREQVIGCAPTPASTSECALLGIVGCAITSDGTFHTPGLAPNWTGPAMGCDDALRAKVTEAAACATTDAGSD